MAICRERHRAGTSRQKGPCNAELPDIIARSNIQNDDVISKTDSGNKRPVIGREGKIFEYAAFSKPTKLLAAHRIGQNDHALPVDPGQVPTIRRKSQLREGLE